MLLAFCHGGLRAIERDGNLRFHEDGPLGVLQGLYWLRLVNAFLDKRKPDYRKYPRRP